MLIIALRIERFDYQEATDIGNWLDWILCHNTAKTHGSGTVQLLMNQSASSIGTETHYDGVSRLLDLPIRMVLPDRLVRLALPNVEGMFPKEITTGYPQAQHHDVLGQLM
jgi:hypothetical protein